MNDRLNLLVVMALDTEAQDSFDDIDVLYTGVGKVNAAVKLAARIHQQKPDHILNLGTAGSTYFDYGSLVNCTSFVQRDMDVTALNIPLYQTPFEDGAIEFNYGYRMFEYHDGICGTGDRFETNAYDAPFNVVDMEAFALAKCSETFGIPFTCIKYITDGADEDAAGDWESALPIAAKALRGAYDKVLASLLSKQLK